MPAPPQMSDSATALVSARALCRNIEAIRGRIPPGLPVCAAVKANAYGHGLDQVLPALSKARVERLAVASLEEGLDLRRLGWTRPILSLGPLPTGGGQTARAEPAFEAVAAGIAPTISTLHEIQPFIAAARRLQRAAHIEVQADTGMGRNGVGPETVMALLAQVTRYSEVVIDGLYMHFATADEPDLSFAREQLARFCRLIDQIKAAGLPVRTFHAANSAATFRLPESHLDMVRPGLSVYGYWGGPETERPDDLCPTMRIVSHVTELRHLPAGSPIGYGCTHVTKRDSLIGTVPIGYADGYRRLLSNKAMLTIRSTDGTPPRTAPVVGRVSMDQINVDLTHAGPIQLGDEVTVISDDPAAPNSVEALARLADTIPYEITTLLGRRVCRVAAD
jgi:alanine racemase